MQNKVLEKLRGQHLREASMELKSDLDRLENDKSLTTEQVDNKEELISETKKAIKAIEDFSSTDVNAEFVDYVLDQDKPTPPTGPKRVATKRKVSDKE